jgi:hypothetical protein
MKLTHTGKAADKTYKLSPAEKVDLALNRTDFPFLGQEFA